MSLSNKALIESVLYVAGVEGIDIADIKRVVEIPTNDIRKIIKEIKKEYDESPNHGITIEQFGEVYKFLTKPECHANLSKIYEIKSKNPLSAAMLETLAIIAYNSPCSGSEIEQIRGRDASNILSKLQTLNLIKCIGRADTPGRPYLYEVTNKFFDIFGLKSLNDLPNPKEKLVEEDEFSTDFFDNRK